MKFDLRWTAAVLLMAAINVSAQDFPSKPIRVIVGPGPTSSRASSDRSSPKRGVSRS